MYRNHNFYITETADDIYYDESGLKRTIPNLWKTAQDRPVETASILVKKYKKLVIFVAWQVFQRVSNAIEIEDLAQIGMLAMIEAAGSYEDRGAVSVQAYIRMRVRGAMIDALRQQAPLTRNSMLFNRQLAAANSRLQTQLGRAPTEGEIANHLSMDIGTYRTQLRRAVPTTSQPIDAHEADTNADYADPSADGLVVLTENCRRADLANAMSALPEREATVIRHYFTDELSLKEIGEKLNIGAARVCQIKRSALDHLRGQLAGWSPQ